MKKGILIGCMLAAALSVSAGECNALKQPLLGTLSQELNRNFNVLKKQKPPVYYLSYQLVRSNSFTASADQGGLSSSSERQGAYADIVARAGSPKLDNTHELKGQPTDLKAASYAVPVETEDPLALKNVLWRATQDAAEKAQKEFNKVQTNIAVSSANTDSSDDFRLPPKSLFCEDSQRFAYDRKAIEERLKRLSLLAKGQPYVMDSGFNFSLEETDNYFVDSAGSRIQTSRALARFSFYVAGRNDDGMRLERNVIFDGVTWEDFPSEEEMAAAVRQALAELKALKTAPVMEPYIGPVILKNRASGVFFHEILGHRVEGHRQKSDSFGQTFTQKVGRQVVSPLLTVSDNPTLERFNGVPLRGFYRYDDEGVAAQPVTIIEKGVLKNFLMSSSPIKNFPASNGHGRKSKGYRAVSRMGNTIITPAETMPYEQLEARLIEEIKRQGKPYGLIIEDISGGFTMTDTSAPQSFKVNPLLVYRIYPDGRKEVVRGADLVGTPLTSFSRVIAAGDDYVVFNGTCGAESGWVPVSAVSPSVLVSEMEVEKVEKSSSKPPVLLPPAAEKSAKEGK